MPLPKTQDSFHQVKECQLGSKEKRKNDLFVAFSCTPNLYYRGEVPELRLKEKRNELKQDWKKTLVSFPFKMSHMGQSFPWVSFYSAVGFHAGCCSECFHGLCPDSVA